MIHQSDIRSRLLAGLHNTKTSTSDERITRMVGLSTKAETAPTLPDSVTNVYVACFHSQPGLHLSGSSGQFEKVEKAISKQEWPYDNGDDPSFYIARRGGPLTWGVCRPNVRTALRPDDIVVFVSFTKAEDGCIHYRLCSVATVDRKLDHRYLNREHRLRQLPYLNQLVRLERATKDWVHVETERPTAAQHERWLWLIARQKGLRKEDFEEVQNEGRFTTQTIIGGQLLEMACNYVIFSKSKTLISNDPPEIAFARPGGREIWTRTDIKKCLFVSVQSRSSRQHLRTATRTGYAHPHIHWSMRREEADEWRTRIARLLKNT